MIQRGPLVLLYVTLWLGIIPVTSASAGTALVPFPSSPQDRIEGDESLRAQARRDLNAQKIRDLISLSPDDYVAAVQEVVDDSGCYGPRDGSSCFLQVRIVDYLGGNPGRHGCHLIDPHRDGR